MQCEMVWGYVHEEHVARLRAGGELDRFGCVRARTYICNGPLTMAPCS